MDTVSVSPIPVNDRLAAFRAFSTAQAQTVARIRFTFPMVRSMGKTSDSTVAVLAKSHNVNLRLSQLACLGALVNVRSFRLQRHRDGCRRLPTLAATLLPTDQAISKTVGAASGVGSNRCAQSRPVPRRAMKAGSAEIFACSSCSIAGLE